MTVSSDLPSLYVQRPVNLWVEDDETRAYLDSTWQDADIGFLVAGGSENVGAVVKAAREAGIPTVFGVKDRDFGRTNRGRWLNGREDLLVFSFESLEVENFALDPVAIAASDANTAALSPTDIERMLETAASQMVWYMSCRHTISDVHDAANRDFIEHPKPHGPTAVTRYEDARDRILGSDWWQSVLPAARVSLTAANVELALRWHHEFYSRMMSDGRWQQRFSGKEILSSTINSIWRRGRTPSPRRDLLMMVARSQRTLGRVPREVLELHEALRARGGLAPKPLS